MADSTETKRETSAKYGPLDDLALIYEMMSVPDMLDHVKDGDVDARDFLAAYSQKYGWDAHDPDDELELLVQAIENDAHAAVDRLRAYFGDEDARERLRRNGSGPVENPYG